MGLCQGDQAATGSDLNLSFPLGTPSPESRGAEPPGWSGGAGSGHARPLGRRGTPAPSAPAAARGPLGNTVLLIAEELVLLF